MNIAILASGGDAPGMNTCIHYLTRFLYPRYDVFAFKYGFCGLIDNDIIKLSPNLTNKYKKEAGVFIKSSRCKEFESSEGVNKAILNLKKSDIHCLIVLGGDGSFKGCRALVKKKINVIFIPATIDRDLPYKTYSIGFHSAAKACYNYIKAVIPTMNSFDRTCVYEIMGRENPTLTHTVGKMIGADLVVTNDNLEQIDYAAFKQKYEENPVRTVLLQEKFVPIDEMVKTLENLSGGDVRSCVIGYYQRGNNPTKEESIKAKTFARHAARLLSNKKFGVALALNETLEIIDIK